MKNKKQIYIDADRFRIAVAENPSFSPLNKQLAIEIGVNNRQFQYYVSGKKPIPENRFTTLCDLLDVTPDWLTGAADLSVQHRKTMINAKKNVTKRAALLNYLYLAGIKPEKAENIEIKQKDVRNKNRDWVGGVLTPSFRSINGVSLTEKQFEIYINELEKGIAYFTERFLENICNM